MFFLVIHYPLKSQNDSINRIVLLNAIEVSTYHIERGDSLAYFYSVRGWAYYSIDSLDYAMSDFDSAIKFDSRNDDLYFRRGEVLFDLRRMEECIKDYSSAININSRIDDYYIARGLAYFESRDYSQALDDYNLVLKRDSKNEIALRSRAILYFEGLKDTDLGLKDFNRLLSINPKSTYYNDRGWYLMMARKFSLAIIDFDKALKIEPKNSFYLVNRAYSYGMLKKWTESLRDFEFSESINPKNPFLYKFKGIVLYEMGNRETACGEFNKAKSLGLNVDELLANCN